MMPKYTSDQDGNGDWRSDMFATPDIEVRTWADGGFSMRSRTIVSDRARTVLDWLAHWAGKTPNAAFVTEVVAGGERRSLSYEDAWRDAGRIGAGLLENGLRRGDRIAVIAPNGIRHMRIAMAALRAGVIYVPIAPQYAAPGGDEVKLAGVFKTIAPGAIYCDDLAAAPLLRTQAAQLIVGKAGLDALIASAHGVSDPDVADLDPLAPAKLLLTSGSTGSPKPVPYSHMMMTDNLMATVKVWPFMERRKPVLVDWLPWNHAFGGNNNVHLVLSQGGTLHIDQSRGRPEGFDVYVHNLRTFRPTFHGAVPSGWAALLSVIESDPSFCEAFFSNLDVMFSAGAAMAPDTFQRLTVASARIRGAPVPILTGWGATETGPGATIVHAVDVQPGWIGTPLPGAEIRLVPQGDKFELRVRGQSVMHGYWGDVTTGSPVFDEQGFYRTGDAGRLIDPNRPELGLLFDGRLAEDFKLANGSWVNAGGLRREILNRANGALRDVVILGADRAHVAALCWVQKEIALDELFSAHNRTHGSQTMRIERFGALASSPTGDELTAKGEINRKVLLTQRMSEVEALFDVKEDK